MLNKCWVNTVGKQPRDEREHDALKERKKAWAVHRSGERGSRERMLEV